ncbi:intercellular adhesion molecule 5 isoform X7 [Pleurodeles waltl]|uniref:intercellular adhesion molecule 5 isoform X7 n=1 Tax=Pleurodeles waltl TaxID=8319 RepID=UPI0037098897
MNRGLGLVCPCISHLGVWLLLAVSARNPCDLRILGPVPLFAEYGKSISLNCTMRCPNSAKGWETSLKKTELSEGSYWTWTTVAIGEWVSYPQCYVIDVEGDVSVTNTTIKAYQPPENVSISLPPLMQVGHPYFFTCSVQAVAPMEYFTMFLRKGNTTLHATSYHNVFGNSNFTHSQIIIAQRADHGVEYTCLARLYLTPSGELFEKSASVLVHTFGLPKEPTIDVLDYMELGSVVMATCKVAEAFPLEDVEVALQFDGRDLNVSVTRDNDMLTLEGAVPSDWPGKHMLACQATVSPKGEAKTVERFVYIYSFPEPYLNIQDVNTLAGQDVNITCVLQKSDPREALVVIKGNATLKTCKGRTEISCSHILRIEKEDHNRKITCEATLGFLNIFKTASFVLNVSYAPKFNSSLCSKTHTWVEGAQAIIPSCEAVGNPPPHVQCTNNAGVNVRWNGSEITRNQSGIYQCLATNKHGHDAINIAVTVEYGPAFSEFTCPSTLMWVEGTAATFSCEADGRPTPRVECTKDGGPNAIRHWPTVTRHDAGTYRCNTSNRHGVALKNVAVRVEYKPGFSDTLCPSSVTWVEGTDVTSACQASGNPTPYIECIQEGGTKTLTNWSHITRYDYGTYQCHASNIHGFDVKNVTVTVEYGPEFTDVLCPSSQMWVEGDQDIFTCNADGNPAPVVKCFVDDRPDVQGHGPGITRPHSGLYQCKASNLHGIALKNVTVVTQYPPKFNDALCLSLLTWTEGSLTTFSCEADGNPTPSVKCTKDGIDKPVNQWLKISRNDSGFYQCIARNSHGSDVWNVEVIVEYKPDITCIEIIPSESIYRGQKVTLKCQANGFPGPTYHWRTPYNSSLTYSPDNSTVTIMAAEFQHGGVYECEVRNKHGSNRQQKEIHVKDILPIILGVVIGALALVGMAGISLKIYLLHRAEISQEYQVSRAQGVAKEENSTNTYTKMAQFQICDT